MKSLLILFCFILSLTAQRSYDYDKMTKEQYDAELLNWRNRNSTAEYDIQKSQREIDSLTNLKTTVKQESSDLWTRILAMAEVNEESFKTFMTDLNQLRSDVSSFNSLSSEEIYKRRKEIDGFENRLNEFKNKKASRLSQAQTVIRNIEDLIAQIRQKATLPNSMYEVVKGDYLWKIAKKGEVYGDPYAWTRIYNSNKNIIKDPNLIFPNQTFAIPRSVDANQYLVERGDNLAKIASKFGGTFSWYKLFQANKDLLQDQNMIMPYQVLTLPNN